jgi:hypothetical protein
VSYRQFVQKIKVLATKYEASEIIHEGRASNANAHNIDHSSVSFDGGRQVCLLNSSEGICNHVPRFE